MRDVEVRREPLGALLVKTKRTYRALEANGTTYKDNNLVDLISQLDTCGPTDSCDGAPANSTAQTRYGYDEGTVTAFPSTLSTLNTSPPGPRGNRTSAARWSSKRTPAGFVTTTSTYFNTGMVKSVQDPQTHTTNFDYSPTFWGGYLTQSTNALNQTTSSDYDFSTGLPKSTTDPNGVITKFVSYDTALRLTQKKLAVGTPNEAQIDYFYYRYHPGQSEGDGTSCWNYERRDGSRGGWAWQIASYSPFIRSSGHCVYAGAV